MLSKKNKNGYHKVVNKQTGKVKFVKHYKNGLVHGKVIYYWDNGQIRLIGEYNNMHRVGIWKTYNFNGDLILEENYTTNSLITNKTVLFPI